MTQEELAESIDRAVQGFSQLEGMTIELAERLVEEGFLSYDDLSVIEPDALMAMGEMTEEEVDAIVAQAEEKALEAEAAAQDARRRKREEDRLATIEAEFQATEAANRGAPEGAGEVPSLEASNGAEPSAAGDAQEQAAHDAGTNEGEAAS